MGFSDLLLYTLSLRYDVVPETGSTWAKMSAHWAILVSFQAQLCRNSPRAGEPRSFIGPAYGPGQTVKPSHQN